MKPHEHFEVWLRGTIPGIPALLQPVAHTLLQAQEEVNTLMNGFDDTLLWETPADVASVGFHLQHLCGVLDRLYTYAKGEQLSGQQLDDLRLEGTENAAITSSFLIERFNKQVDKALSQLRETNQNMLTQPRGVGRKQIPSTVLGLLFHAAEHTQRHNGQLLVTVRVLKNR